jgi:hypothetical protein
MIARLKQWAAMAGVALTVIVGAFVYGRTKGKADAKASQASDALKASRKAREIEDDVRKMDGGDIDSRLSDWMRDGR